MKVAIISILLCLCAGTFGQANFQDDIVSDHAERDVGALHMEVGLKSASEAVSLLDSQAGVQLNARNSVSDAIAELLESFRDVIINGNDDLPPLDPLEVPHLGPYQVTVSTGTRATANIRDLNVDGLRWYVVDQVTFSALRLSLGAHVTVPRITVSGQYDAEARLALFIRHTAGGLFRIFMHRIEVGVDLRLGTNLFAGHLILRELNVKIDIHDTHIQIHGMTGSSIINNFINAAVQNTSQQLIQNELENVSQLISQELFDVINEVLKDYTLDDLLG